MSTRSAANGSAKCSNGRPPFGRLLRFWRKALGLSQEELADQAAVSARHISFLENGRAAPSRAAAIALAGALRLGPNEASLFLLAAGHAPESDAASVDSRCGGPADDVLALALRHADPLPSMVMDSIGNIRLVNRAWVAVHRHYLGGLIDDGCLNALHLFMHEQGWRQYIHDWQSVAGVLLVKMQQEALLSGDAQAAQLVQDLSALPGMGRDWTRRYVQRSAAGTDLALEFREASGRTTAIRIVHSLAGVFPYVGRRRLIIQTVYPAYDGAVLTEPIVSSIDAATHALCPY